MLRVPFQLLLSFTVIFLLPSFARADDVTLAWDASSGHAPAGYRVRYRAIASSILEEREAGRATSITIAALTPGTTYEFHVVAYDGAGRTSPPSNTVRATISGSPSPPPPSPPQPPAAVPADPPPHSPVTTPYFPGLAVVDPAPSQRHRVYLAHGAHDATFRTQLALANPTPETAAATVYLRRDGDEHSHAASLTLPPYSHTEVDAHAIVGGQTGAFSAGVTSSVPISVSRTITWGRGSGEHSELAVAASSTRWYFAEGATHGRFVLFYHLLNPGPAPATVAITYLLTSGASMVRYHDLPAGARTTVFVKQEDPELASTDVATVVESLTGQPIVAERAMYVVEPHGYAGGHATVGAPELRSRWLFAEGATGPYVNTYVLLANPHDRSATAELRFHQADGVPVRKQVTVPARGRTTVDVASADAQLSGTSIWTEVVTPPDLPIVAERVMWWPGHNWQDGRAAIASARTAPRWLAPGGQQRSPQRHAHYVVVANASDARQRVRLTVLGPDGSLGTTVVDIPPQRRYDVDMAAAFPDLTGQYSVLVEAVSGDGLLVVEQSLYRDAGGQAWTAVAAAPAQPLQD